MKQNQDKTRQSANQAEKRKAIQAIHQTKIYQLILNHPYQQVVLRLFW